MTSRSAIGATMVFIVVPEKSQKSEKKPLLSRILNTAKEYASETTIHGFSYIANTEHHTVARIFWVLVVILALLITTFQMASLRTQWEANPVVTNLETIALPIEDIKFPAVTICPQGSVKDVMDNVLFQQLTEYVSQKEQTYRSKRSTSQETSVDVNKNASWLWNMTYEEMLLEIEAFIRDVYPGAHGNPANFVKLLASDDPLALIKNEAVVLQQQEKECNETSNRDIVDTLNKQLNNDFCPDGFEKFSNIGCVLVAEPEMDYNEASSYCRDMYGANVLHLDSFDDIMTLDEHNIIGTIIKKNITHMQIYYNDRFVTT